MLVRLLLLFSIFLSAQVYAQNQLPRGYDNRNVEKCISIIRGLINDKVFDIDFRLRNGELSETEAARKLAPLSTEWERAPEDCHNLEISRPHYEDLFHNTRGSDRTNTGG